MGDAVVAMSSWLTLPLLLLLLVEVVEVVEVEVGVGELESSCRRR